MQVVSPFRLFLLSVGLTGAIRALFCIFSYSCGRLETAFESPDILISSVLCTVAALCLYLKYLRHAALTAAV